MAIPQTSDEARKEGYEVKRLSAEDANRLMNAGPNLDTFAKVKKVDCANLPNGGMCWEGNCIDGWKEVLYCNGTFCVDYARIRCP